MIIVTVILCIVFSVLFQSTRADLRENSERMLHMAIKGEPARPIRPEEPDHLRLPCFTLQDGPWNTLIASGNGFDLTDEAMMQTIFAQTLAEKEETGVLKDYDLRYIRKETTLGHIAAYADISTEQAALASLAKTCSIITLVTFTAFLAISMFLAHWAVKPVDVAWRQQKQFVADASHELKTPLTVILTNAEMLQNPVYEPAERQQFANSILAMSYQMRGLVEALLDLARVDNGAAQSSFTEVNLSELISDGVLPFEPLFFEKEMTMQTRIDPDIRIKGSENHMRQVLDIFLDNAMKYAAPNAYVQVGLRKHGHNCLLAVGNTGSAISQEDLKHIFDRFYRADQARAMNRSYGLGLSIAKNIVLNHRGKIWAESERGFNTFYVQLPML